MRGLHGRNRSGGPGGADSSEGDETRRGADARSGGGAITPADDDGATFGMFAALRVPRTSKVAVGTKESRVATLPHAQVKSPLRSPAQLKVPHQQRQKPCGRPARLHFV
jgi:hypothetical protein